MALVRVTNDLLLTVDSGQNSLLLLLDLSAAFDTVDHTILLNRLQNHVGIQGSALTWFHSYLTNRTQCMTYNEATSRPVCVGFGVPQGSVLGPILFCIYLLPLGNTIHRFNIKFHCYTDDTQLYVPIQANDPTQFSTLEAGLAEIKKWMYKNFLMLNAEKTELFVVRPRRAKTQTDLRIYVNDCDITESAAVKSPGVTFDSFFNVQIPH